MNEVDHCIALLSWVSKNRDVGQTFRSLSEATGIPERTLRDILDDAVEDSLDCMLREVADDFGYQYYIYKKRPKRSDKKIIDVVKRSFTNNY